MPKTTYGDCIGCEQPIRPPYLMFDVKLAQAPTGDRITEWEEIDVCDDCAKKLTAADLHRLCIGDGDEEAAESVRLTL